MSANFIRAGRSGSHLGSLHGSMLGLTALTAAGCMTADPAGESRPRDPMAELSESFDLVENEQGHPRSAAGEMELPSEAGVSSEEQATWFLLNFGAAWDVSEPEDIRHQKTMETLGDGTIVVFERVEDGVPVFGADVRVEITAPATVRTVVAKVPFDLDQVSTTPTITAAEADDTARAAYDSATVHDGELMLLNTGLFLGYESSTRLVYRVDLAAPEDPVRFVDAHSGALLRFSSTDRIDFRDRQVSTVNGECGGLFAPHTRVFNEAGPVPGTTATSDSRAAYEHGARVWDYFFQEFGRNGHDGQGSPMILVTDTRKFRAEECHPWSGASWVQRAGGVYFAEGYVTLDILAHEYTHGMTDFLPIGEPGAINEAISDAFAAFIDTTDPWRVGENSIGGTVRDLRTPSRHGLPYHTDVRFSLPTPPAVACQTDADCGSTCPADGCDPDRFCTDFECSGAADGRPGTCHAAPGRCDDRGGVHVNVGILNHATFLMTEGGEGPTGVQVQGIGVKKAEQVFWHAIPFLPYGADFNDFRFALRRAVTRFALRGEREFTFNDCGSVVNALHAVGLGTGDRDRDCFPDDDDNCPDFYNPRSQGQADACGCGSLTTCATCAQANGCTYCDGTCVSEGSQECRQAVRDPAMCAPACGNLGTPCGGSGPAFDGECCGDAICVVGSCRARGNREQASCGADEPPCADGLSCRPQGRADGPSTCCARDRDPCSSKADCCGMQECSGGVCVGRTTGQSCAIGDCVGASTCNAGTCG
ncbi:MAG: M4 family metallopeptidase [Myxococcota bacterium]